MSVLTLEARLERHDSGTPWGFRVQGGKDFNSPLVIQNVTPGSLAAKCGLQVGDAILKIGSTSTEFLQHKEAQSTIVHSGNQLQLLLQRRGNDTVRDNDTSNHWKSQPQPHPVSPQSFQPKQYPSSPGHLFGSQAAAQSNYESSLSKQTSDLSLASEPKEPPEFQSAAEKYAERQNAPNPAQHQSRSFRKLASLIDEDTGPGTEASTHPLAAAPIGPGSKPGTVKAIVSQRYNNPIGLYSNENVNTQLQGQSKFLIESDEAASGGPTAVPASFRKPKAASSYQQPQIQVATAAAAKPWAPPPAPAKPPASAAHPPANLSALPVPSGIGAIRGKKGDAAMNPAILPTAGHIPVCTGCHLSIRGPFVTALGKCWCPNHFVCANPQCGIQLQDTGFVEEGGYLYCEQDYATHFAPHCDKCGQAIVGECVNAVKKSYHPGCFLCTQCHKPISGTKFHVEQGKFYCESDWMALFQTMCSGCNFPIEPGDKWLEAFSKNFHSECFNCATCQINLEGQQFCAKGGRAYCKKHAN